MIVLKRALQYLDKIDYVKAKIAILEAELESGFHYTGNNTNRYRPSEKLLDDIDIKEKTYVLNTWKLELEKLEPKQEEKVEEDLGFVCNDPLPF